MWKGKQYGVTIFLTDFHWSIIPMGLVRVLKLIYTNIKMCTSQLRVTRVIIILCDGSWFILCCWLNLRRNNNNIVWIMVSFTFYWSSFGEFWFALKNIEKLCQCFSNRFMVTIINTTFSDMYLYTIF